MLKYKDETDKSLGIAGMAIGLVAMDCEEYIAAVSLDPADDSLVMSREYYVTANPNFSAKLLWKAQLRNHEVNSAVLLANVLCRAMAAGQRVAPDSLAEIHSIIINDGCRQCDLDRDEVEEMYRKAYNYYYRLFSHPSVAVVARDFATTLRMQRRMTTAEILDNLRRLSSL